MKNNSAIILLLLAVGLFYVFTNTQYKDVKKLYALSSEYQNVLQNASRIMELRDQLLVNYEALPVAEIERINKVLPDSIDTVRLALDLDGIASRYGIAIKNIQTATAKNKDTNLIVLPEAAGAYEKATISFGFVSNYENFMRLLADIEKSLRIMDVRSISFQTGESNFYDYQISIDTYWLKTDSVSGEPQASGVGNDLLKIFDELQKVTLDSSLFSSSGYLELTDFSTNITPQATGRTNPFDVIGRD
ncbi:MAG: hypothetical protein Q8Q92_00360 [bacterium]|nr:hypothetical protein [bacterium]